MFYRRKLPHWFPPGAWIFVTWRLAGSTPARNGAAATGPMWLNQPTIANAVRDRILRLTPDEADVKAWCLMANHVHLLLQPKTPPVKLIQQVKGASAREANLLLGNQGKPFWHPESFDHWIRNDSEIYAIHQYIENNPVEAGLVANATDYPYSSAHRPK